MTEAWVLVTSGDADPVLAAIALIHEGLNRATFLPTATRKTKLIKFWPK